jgi:translation initiation factor eIF-2B subunit gamma
MNTCDIDCVILGAGPGSRMLDVTGGGAKCLISVAGHPLLYYSLKILEANGFKSVIVTVPDNVKTEVSKLSDKYKLDLKLDVVGIPMVSMAEEWGTLDTLRHIQDKLTGRDTLLMSADLITNTSIKMVVDYHRSKACGLTVLLNKPASDLKSRVTPGSKTTKFKLERDLIGLSNDGQSLCFFQAEADVEEKVHIPGRLLHAQPRFTIHSNLQDTHLYILNRLSLAEYMSNKSMSTVKGELIPQMVANQFKQPKKTTHKQKYSLENKELRVKCHAIITDEPTLRVNNIPNYWQAFQLIKTNLLLPTHSDHQHREDSASVHDKSHVDNCSFGAKCQVHAKTTLKGSAVCAGAVVNEKVKIANSVLMDGVTVNSNAVVNDSIVCEGAVISPGAEISLCIIGKHCTVAEGASIANQVLLDSDSMMQL